MRSQGFAVYADGGYAGGVFKMTIPEITSLIEKAKQATPGKWSYDDGNIICGDGWGFSAFPAQYYGGCASAKEHGIKIPKGIDCDKDSEYVAAANPFDILSLAQSYLEALELIQDLKSTAETHAMQSYSKTSWKNVEQANAFLKKVGCE